MTEDVYINGEELTELCGCGSKDMEEIDGQEFEVQSLRELVNIIALYKEVHLNYFQAVKKSGNKLVAGDIDMWIKEIK